MGTKVIDWESLKAEYLTSDILNVSEFIKSKLGKHMNGGYYSKTVGWVKEKKAWNAIKAQEAVSRAAEMEIQEMALALFNSRKALVKKALSLANEDGKKMSAKDLEKVWKMARVENKLPINITRATIEEVADPEDAFDSLRSRDVRKNKDKASE